MTGGRFPRVVLTSERDGIRVDMAVYSMVQGDLTDELRVAPTMTVV